MGIIDLLETIVYDLGKKDGETVAKKDNEFIDYIEDLFSKVDFNELLNILKPEPIEDCPINNELIDKLKKIDETKNCVPCPNTDGFNLCKQPYALCTSAKCIRLKSSNMVICYCDVLSGCSFGTQTCDSLKPFKIGNLDFLYSTYNPIQSSSNCNHIVTYPNELNDSTTFANCLNQICIIDRTNKQKAFCFCPLQVSDPWVTVGNEVVIDPNIYLSGASLDSFQSSVKYFETCKEIIIPQ